MFGYSNALVKTNIYANYEASRSLLDFLLVHRQCVRKGTTSGQRENEAVDIRKEHQTPYKEMLHFLLLFILSINYSLT